MDFIDEVRALSERVGTLKDVVETEEATKNSMILPFFKMLGYDVFNPLEFVPEFTADVGIKKGEKVDYAIIINGKPEILIEAKWCGAKLENHDSQLFRYFGTTAARYGILTNGITYRFYTDLDASNKMDDRPFMEFDLLNMEEGLIPELKRFQRTTYDADTIFSAASDLKYSSAIKKYLAKQSDSPEEAFVSFIMLQVYPGRRTQAQVEKFTELVKNSLNQYVMELMNDRFKSVMEAGKEKQKDVAESVANQQESIPTEPVKAQIITTDEEREAYAIVKVLLRDVIDPSRLTFRDTVNYSIVEIDAKDRKWVCRFRLNSARKQIGIHEGTNEMRIDLTSVDSIIEHKEVLAKTVLQLLE